MSLPEDHIHTEPRSYRGFFGKLKGYKDYAKSRASLAAFEAKQATGIVVWALVFLVIALFALAGLYIFGMIALGAWIGEASGAGWIAGLLGVAGGHFLVLLAALLALFLCLRKGFFPHLRASMKKDHEWTQQKNAHTEV
ncbi:MAG: hypothetical protein ACFCU3_03360 [Verrucomicrobiales bacterium]